MAYNENEKNRSALPISTKSIRELTGLNTKNCEYWDQVYARVKVQEEQIRIKKPKPEKLSAHDLACLERNRIGQENAQKLTPQQKEQAQRDYDLWLAGELGSLHQRTSREEGADWGNYSPPSMGLRPPPENPAASERPPSDGQRFAAGIRRAEVREAQQKGGFIRAVSAMPMADHKHGADGDNGADPKLGVWRQEYRPTSYEERKQSGSVLGISDKDRQLLQNIGAKSPPGEPTGKRLGRPPIGVRAMTNTERSRRRRARKKLELAE